MVTKTKILFRFQQDQVFDIDDTMLAHEFLELMDTQLAPDVPEIFSEPQFTFTDFETTQQTFLNSFYQLTTK